MKVKILTSYPKQTIDVDKVWFSSDWHLNHEAIIKFGRCFDNVSEMNDSILYEINKVVRENDLLILMGDTAMGDKNYDQILNSLVCNKVIMLYGNHCNVGKMLGVQSKKLIYHGYYLELNIEGQIVCCQHFPQFNWNYQDDGAIMVHGHLHSDESDVVKEIHKYKSIDVGIDNFYKLFGEYSVFSFEKVKQLLKDKLIIGRHG